MRKFLNNLRQAEWPALDVHSLIPQSGASFPYKVVTIGRTNVVDQAHFNWEVIQVYIVKLKQFLKLKIDRCQIYQSTNTQHQSTYTYRESL